MGQYRITYIRGVPLSPTTEYVAVITYFQLCCILLRKTLDNPTGPVPAPHITRFVARSDELLNSKYGRSANKWGGEAHSNPYR